VTVPLEIWLYVFVGAVEGELVLLTGVELDVETTTEAGLVGAAVEVGATVASEVRAPVSE
jgi:hypothetical protein